VNAGMGRDAPAEANRHPAIAAFVACSGLIASGAAAWFERLPGGDSSDIWLVRAGSGVDWEHAAAIETRATHLPPGLLLARVDGKSPVEYLKEERDKAVVRRAARALLANPPDRLAGNLSGMGERDPAWWMT
jgi:hypothetical protein